MADEVLNNDDMNLIIKAKDDEIKNIYNNKIKQLEIRLHEKEIHVKKLEDELNTLKKDFVFNLTLIEDRDNDLKIFEEKVDSFLAILGARDNEIKRLNASLIDLEARLQNEKGRKDNEIEMYKYKLNQQAGQSKDELKALNKLLTVKEKEMEDLKFTHAKALEDLSKRNEDGLKALKDDVIGKSNLLAQREVMEKEYKDKEMFLHKRIEDITNSFNKANNENLLLIREKMQLETKLKLLETSEGECKSNSYFVNERNKCLLKENEELKLEVESKIYKIENLNEVIEGLNIELHGLKQKINFKDFEIEKKQFEAKSLGERLKDITQSYDKLKEEKKIVTKELEEERLRSSAIEHKHRLLVDEKEYLVTRHIEEVKRLGEEVKRLYDINQALRKEIEAVDNHRLKKDVTADRKSEAGDDFFMKNDASGYIGNGGKNEPNDYNRMLKEKDDKILELTKEITGFHMVLEQADADIKRLSALAMQLKQFQSDNERLRQEIIRYEIEMKNLREMSNKSNFDESNEINRLKDQLQMSNKETARLKDDLNVKTSEYNRLKDNLVAKQNELAKVKKERDKLAGISNNLRAEVNRLENLLHQQEDEHIMYDTNEPYYEDHQHYGEDISRGAPDYFDFNEFKKKKEQIMGNSIKAEAKKHIDNILNTDERSKSNGIRSGLRRVQVDNLNKSRGSRSVSLSPKGREDINGLKDLITVTRVNYDSNNYINHPDEKIYEDMPCVSVGQVKLLKRNRSKPKVEN
jgi:DNA repair exonuclease SbcCD ATPase subunit